MDGGTNENKDGMEDEVDIMKPGDKKKGENQISNLRKQEDKGTMNEDKCVEETTQQEASKNVEEVDMEPSVDKKCVKTKKRTSTWNTISDFGYHFNNKGELRDIKTDSPFEFNVYENRSDNQRRYERLGEVIEEHVYELLQTEGGLEKTSVPIDAGEDEAQTFIFRSSNASTCKKLILLIHGSGVVRAGQWARSLIINHSLEAGSQLPYIKKAKQLGYGVLVLNTNYNRDKESKEAIRESSSPEEHFVHVWNNFVVPSAAEHVGIVAHSYGGVVTTRAAALLEGVIEKTFAVAFTDSVHFSVRSPFPKKFSSFMRNRVCNWVTSGRTLDTPLRTDAGDCPNVSAGTGVHAETSWKAFESVWKFIEKKWKQVETTTSEADTVDIKKCAIKEPVSKRTKKEKDEVQCTQRTDTDIDSKGGKQIVDTEDINTTPNDINDIAKEIKTLDKGERSTSSDRSDIRNYFSKVKDECKEELNADEFDDLK